MDYLCHSKACFLSKGDGRNDSPGHSAKYCTYTVVEQDTMNIVAFLVVDKRTTKLVSTNMEVEAFKIVLNHLLEKEMNVVEVVTDAHSSVTKWLSKLLPNIQWWTLCVMLGVIYIIKN